MHFLNKTTLFFNHCLRLDPVDRKYYVDTAIAITAGTGTNVDTRTEATNGNHRQVVILGDPSTNAGVAPVDATAGLKVDLGADNDITGTVTANLGATDNAVLDTIDAVLDTINAKLVTGTVIGDVNLGAVDNAVLDTIDAVLDTIKTDTASIVTATQLIDNAISGTEMQVDVVASLPAGTNAIGKLAANSGVDIGDVDVTSFPTTVHSADFDSGVGTDSTLAFGIAVPASGGAAVIPGDATAGLKVDLGADNDVTVTGTVTANLSATDNTVLDNIDADLTTVIGHVDGLEALLTTIDADTSSLSVVGGGVEAAAIRVTIANDSTGVLSVDDNGSSLTVDNAALTELAAAINTNKVDVNIVSSDVATGGTSAVDDADFTALTTTGTPAMGVYESTPSSVTDGDMGIVGITADRALRVNVDNEATVALSATDNAVLDTIDAVLDTIKVDTEAIEIAVEALQAGQLADGHNVTIDNATGASAVNIQDGGNSITIDGTVTANLSATDNAVLDNINADTSAIQTAVELLDDTVYTDGTGTPSKAIGVAGSDGTNPQIISTNVSGHVNIADGGNAITVDGTVSVSGVSTAANQSTIIGHVDGIEALLTTIDADTGGILTAVQLIDNAISGTEMQVDVVAALPAGDNNIGNVDVASIAAGDNNIGNVDLASAIPAGANNIGDVDIASALPAGTNAIGDVGIEPRTSGGMDTFRSLDLDETEEEVKASAGQVFEISAFNTTAAPLFLKFYNATAANTTVGTTTPVRTYVIPGNSDSDGAGFIWNNEIGIEFTTAITVACTTGVADTDTGAPSANACIINIGYA